MTTTQNNKKSKVRIANASGYWGDDPTALVGLPLIRTCRMIRAGGVKVL